jgi:hypothetical protein
MTFIRKGEPYPYSLDRPPPRAQHPPSTDTNPQETSETSPVDASAPSTTLPDQQQSSESQSQTAPTNGTTSDLEKLFSKLVPAASPAPTANHKVTLETLFASASSTPSSNVVAPPTANKGLALLDTIFASATPPPPGPLPAPTPPFHHVSSEPFPPPPSAPPSMRLAYASAHPHSDVSSETDPQPDSPELPSSPSRHAAAQLIHSPQPANSQLPQILTQDVISALLGMPPSRTSSVASSQRRYEGDVESSDDPPEADSPIEERPLAHANRARKHELGDVTPRPPLRGFASSEKVLPAHPSSFPSHHSAPSVLPTAATSAPPVPASYEPAPTIGLTPPAVPVAPAPRTGTSPAPRALVPFHEESSLWPYPRAPLDDRDDIVELDFADTSALSDVDAFERRRQNGKKGAKMSKRDRAREREDIERSWDVPGNTTIPNLEVGLLQPAVGRPSTVSPSPRSGAVNAKQPNSASVPVNDPAQAATAPLCGNNNKSKAAKSKSVPNGPNAKASVPPATTQVNGAAIAAIVEAVRNHNHPNGNGSATTDRNEFVREVLTLINVRQLSFSYLWLFFIRYLWLDRPIPRSWTGFGRNIVRGLSVRKLSLSTLASVVAVAAVTCTARLHPAPSPPTLPPRFPGHPYVAPRYQCPCIVARCTTLALTCINIFDAVFSGGCVPCPEKRTCRFELQLWDDITPLAEHGPPLKRPDAAHSSLGFSVSDS